MAELKYVDWDGLVYYDGKIKEYIQDRDENYVKMGGIIPFASLPDPTYYNLHYIYKITDEFTSNSRFDKEGLIYKAGTWIQCIDVHDDASHYRYTIFNEDSIGETADIDLSDYYTKKEVEKKINEAISNIDLPEVNLDNYYTKSEVDDLLPDTDNFVNKYYVDELFKQVVTEGELNTLTNTVAEVQEILEELSQQVETLDFVTPDELEEAIKNIEHPTVDLTGYATEEYVDNAIENIPSVDLSGYAKTAEVDVKLDAKVDRYELNEFATKTFVESEIARAQLGGGDVTEEELTALLSDYYRKDETYSKSEIDAKIPSVEGFATKTYVDEQIQNIDIPEVDLTPYATKDDVAAVESKIPDVNNFATKSELEEAINNIEHPSIDLSDYATKEELTVVQEQSARNEVKLLQVDSELFDIKKELEEIPTKYTTKTELEDAINSIEHPTVDLEGYATEQWVNEQGFIKAVPSEYITESELDAKGYLTEHQDLSEYAKKSDIPEAELFVVNFTAPDFAAAIEAYNNGKLLLLTNAAPDANGYAVMNYVRDDMITFTKFLTSRSETYGSFNTYYLHSDNTWEVSKEVKLNKVEANVSDVTTTNLTNIKIGKEVYRLPETDLSDYYTKSEVDTKIKDIEHPTVDLTGYATEDWVKVVADTNKYEVLPLEGMFVQYNDNEVRINTEHVDMSTVPPQNPADGMSGAYYYVTFRAYAPKGATSVIEGSSDKMDSEHSTLATDKYGRKYTTIWSAIASKSGNTWSKFGDNSTVDKYLGFYYNFWWYNEDKLISKEKVRVILTNDACHNDLVPDAVARSVDTKIETAVKDLATQQYVDTKLSEIELPDVSNFVTNDVVNNLLATKADDIPFTTNKVVKNAIGQFALNDSVKDLTVAQILTNILGLVDYIEPSEPISLVDKLLLEKIPMYSINNEGELAEVPFRIVSASDAPAQSGFYYVEQDGKTIEGGYQDITIRNDELYYIIALPKEIDYNTIIELQSWDPVDSEWISAKMDLISNPATVASLCNEVGVDISHIDTEKYTVWVNEGECTGSILRYTIKEEA